MATHTVENPYPYPNPSQAANSRGGAAFGATAVNELDGNGGDNKGGYYTVTHEIGGKTVVPDGLSGAAVEQRNVGGGVVQSQPSPPVEMPASEVQRYA